jgi:hypothetical protein
VTSCGRGGTLVSGRIRRSPFRLTSEFRTCSRLSYLSVGTTRKSRRATAETRFWGFREFRVVAKLG